MAVLPKVRKTLNTDNMNKERNDGCFPDDLAGTKGFQRLFRWLFECRHDWGITATNGYGLPIEVQCCKCGMYRHRILKADDLPMIAEWQTGRHPKKLATDRVEAGATIKELADNWERAGFRDVAKTLNTDTP